MSRKMENSSTKAGSSGGNTTPPRNPFQKTGSEKVYEVTETKKACVFRVDMPGCPESDLTYWIDANKVHFFADEPAMPEYQNAGRKYGGSMVFNPATYDVKDATAKLIDGVLWITVPKIPGTNASIDVVERLLRYSIN